MSTGGSAARIESLGIPVTKVEDLTGFPECLDGRVKTLHPKVHAGILADRRLDTHVQQLAELGVEPFDLVVSNLYPFRADRGVRRDARRVRRADRHRRPVDGAGRGQEPPVGRHRHLARRRTTTCWPPSPRAGSPSSSASGWPPRPSRTPRRTTSPSPPGWARCSAPPEGESCFPEFGGATFTKVADLRYGENPHQAAALYADGTGGLAAAEQLLGKEMSYNNYVDTDAARRAAWDFDEPAVAIIKHANPCGIAVGADIAEAHRRAHECDPVSAFGGVIATNRPVSRGDGRAGGRGVHRGDRRAGVRRRRRRGAPGAGRTSAILVCDGPEEDSGLRVPDGVRRRARSSRSTTSTPRATTPRPGRSRPGPPPTRPRSPTWPSPGRPAAR